MTRNRAQIEAKGTGFHPHMQHAGIHQVQVEEVVLVQVDFPLLATAKPVHSDYDSFSANPGMLSLLR